MLAAVVVVRLIIRPPFRFSVLLSPSSGFAVGFHCPVQLRSSFSFNDNCVWLGENKLMIRW